MNICRTFEINWCRSADRARMNFAVGGRVSEVRSGADGWMDYINSVNGQKRIE